MIAQYALNVKLRGLQCQFGCFAKDKTLAALPGMEPQFTGLPGRGPSLRTLNESNNNRSKRKETFRHEGVKGAK